MMPFPPTTPAGKNTNAHHKTPNVLAPKNPYLASGVSLGIESLRTIKGVVYSLCALGVCIVARYPEEVKIFIASILN